MPPPLGGFGFGFGFTPGPLGLGSDVPVLSLITNTLQVSLLFPSSLDTVTIHVPGVIPWTVPSLSTVAQLFLELLHISFLLVAFLG